MDKPTLYEYYKVLGVGAGAGMAEVVASYKKLCRIYHPDLNNDPESEELMKRINIAYNVLKERLRREAAFRERGAYARPAGRAASGTESRSGAAYRKTGADEEKEAFSALYGYFMAICNGDYNGAYDYLSSHDRRQISRESFIDWRKSVARLYPMREFRITCGQPGESAKTGEGRAAPTPSSKKFLVSITEDNIAENSVQTGNLEKMAVCERGVWKVYLGYEGVVELTRGFDERFEAKQKNDMAKIWEEYSAGFHPEYKMLNMAGLKKAASREIYRQKRYGGSLTFAAIQVKCLDMNGAGESELLRNAARSIGSSLRVTDIAAYAGDGVFAILFVELRKRNAQIIMDRLAEKIAKNTDPAPAERAITEHVFECWSGRNNADMNGMNAVLKKFRKKM